MIKKSIEHRLTQLRFKFCYFFISLHYTKRSVLNSTFMKNHLFNLSVLITFVFAGNQDASGNKMINSDYVFIGILPFYNGSLPTDCFEIKQEISKIELFLGKTAKGQKIKRSNLTLNLKGVSGPELPSSTVFSVDKWMVSIEGSERPFTGSGNELSEEVIKAIKSAKKDLKITISVIYGRSDSKATNPVTSEFIS